MSKDPLVEAARHLVKLGPDAFSGPDTAAFVAEAGREHQAGALYTRATAEAIAQRDVPNVSPADVAARAYENFIWTHFVCKLLMAADPAAAVDFALTRIDLGELLQSVDSGGSAILSGFHYTGYPIMALALAVSPVAPLISKARVDVVEHSQGERLNDRVVYLSDRSAAIRLTRALKQGRSVWVMLDVVLPTVRIIRARFLGGGMDVGAGLGKIARLSGRPCTPMFWVMEGQDTKLCTGTPILPVERAEEELVQEFVATQASFIARHPSHWLEWYSVLDKASRLRVEVKRGNDQLWERLKHALE